MEIAKITKKIARRIIRILPKGKSLFIKLILKLSGPEFKDIIKVSDGRKFYIDRIKPINKGIFFNDIFEPEITELIRRIVKPGDVAFDFGANLGWHTTLLSSLVGNHSGHVYAFEISDVIVKELRKNLEINDCRNVCVEEMAIGDKIGEVKYYDFDDIGMANLSPDLGGGTSNKTEKLVAMTTLDDYRIANKISRLNFIKCDIDGTEDMFLAGAKKTLACFKPKIIIEVEQSTQKMYGHGTSYILRELEKHGYRFKSIEEGKHPDEFPEIFADKIPDDFSGNVYCFQT